MLQYINKIFLPYVYKELKLPSDYPVLMIFDNFSAQKTDAVLKHLKDNYIHTVYVPPNCMGTFSQWT